MDDLLGVVFIIFYFILALMDWDQFWRLHHQGEFREILDIGQEHLDTPEGKIWQLHGLEGLHRYEESYQLGLRYLEEEHFEGELKAIYAGRLLLLVYSLKNLNSVLNIPFRPWKTRTTFWKEVET